MATLTAEQEREVVRQVRYARAANPDASTADVLAILERGWYATGSTASQVKAGLDVAARRMLSPEPRFTRGCRVEVTGFGRTGKWGITTGRVVGIRSGSVYVVWDGTSFEDEMDPREVQVVIPEPATTS